jgi:pyrrolidone-carboxylate peptidase
MDTRPRRRSTLTFAGLLTVLLGLVAPAVAQERPEPAGTPLPEYARVYHVPAEGGVWQRSINGLPNIMLTGYWPPTNEMLRQFSPNLAQNPGGWIGENWESRGYNIYAFFPEFPQGLGRGEGDLEVDYQDTSADWWPFTDELQPLANITFGRALPGTKWEIEWKARNYAYSLWYDDYLSPWRPTPAPPDGSMPPGAARYCTLPVWEIIDALLASNLNVWPIYDEVGGAGSFLCEFIAYHAMWYHDLHVDPNDPLRNLAAGHIHVGSNVTLEDAIAATEITVRVLTTYLDLQRKVAGDLDCDGDVDFDDINPFVLALSDPITYQQVYPGCPLVNADVDGNGVVDFDDVNPFVVLLSGG